MVNLRIDLCLVVQAIFWEILEESKRNIQWSYENNTCDHIIHVLAAYGPNEQQQCISLGTSSVQRVVHALNDCFPNLPIFIATKLFSRCN